MRLATTFEQHCVCVFLRDIKSSRGAAREAVDDALQIHLADALEVVNEEGVHRYQFARVPGVNMALTELGAQAFEPPDLFVGELDLAGTDVLFQTQQA